MKLTIFMAAIRVSKWKALYDSVPRITSIKDFELVFVSPHDLPPELERIPNVRSIKDHGCPSRCYQLGLLHSQGEYVLYAADDGTFSPTMAIDKAFDSMPKHKKGVVSLKYYEGKVRKRSNIQNLDAFWRINYHRTLTICPYVNSNYYMIMTGLMRRDYLVELGGFDCQFENPGIGAVDLAIRLQNDGAEVVLGEKFMDIENDISSEHAPIANSQNEHDYPLFIKMYSEKSGATRSNIDFDNWKDAPAVWNRRFKGKNVK
ncbi:MAG: hypothetical protein ACXAC5_00865 [Promethearchaeota archaeon]|jgi:hypothetical protein